MVTQRNNDGSIRRPSHDDDISAKVREVSITRAGNQISIPDGMDFNVAIKALTLKQQEEEKTVSLTFDFDLTVPEGALALYRTLEDLYGFVSSMGTPGFFGDTPPQIISVQVSKDKVASVPWGRFGVPGVEGTISTGLNWDNGVPYFQLSASVPGKHRKEIERISDAIRARKDSVYQGASIALIFPNPEEAMNIKDFFPRFMKLNNMTKSDLVFSDDVEEILTTSLFTPIEYTQLCRDNGIPLKRGVLLEGPYGVGKTLTAAVTATLAAANGWTFIHLPMLKDLSKAYAFAKHHQPAVIFCEDLDEVLKDEDERDEMINSILNSIDGIESKGVEIITVFTTNNVEDITQAMLRPGRLDTVVPVRAPDAKAAQRLIRLFAKDKLAEDEDLTLAGQLLSGKNAAVVREVVERSKLGAIRRPRGEGQSLTISAHDIVVAARGMDAHNKLLEPKLEDERSDIEKAAEVLGNKLLQIPLVERGLVSGGKVEALTQGLSNGHLKAVQQLHSHLGSDTPDAE